MLDPKYNVRRRMAKTSFALLIGTVFALLAIVVWGDEHVPAKLTAASGILIMILGCFTSIIGGYIGITHHAETRKSSDSRD